jgi:hypothetical protein
MQTENAVAVERDRCARIWRAGLRYDRLDLARYLILDGAVESEAIEFIHSFEKRNENANENES